MSEEYCRICNVEMQLFENEAEIVCTQCGYTIQTDVFIDQYEDFQRSRCKSFINVKKTEYKPKLPYFIKNEHKILDLINIFLKRILRQRHLVCSYSVNFLIMKYLIFFQFFRI